MRFCKGNEVLKEIPKMSYEVWNFVGRVSSFSTFKAKLVRITNIFGTCELVLVLYCRLVDSVKRDFKQITIYN